MCVCELTITSSEKSQETAPNTAAVYSNHALCTGTKRAPAGESELLDLQSFYYLNILWHNS